MSEKDWIDITIGSINIIIIALTCIFIFRSNKIPLKAVQLGRILNDEQNKDSAKRNLFLTLYALRGTPVNYDYVQGLNKIDIVFEDSPLVLAAWHTHYDSLHNKNLVDERTIWDLQRTNLLSAMAVQLGYSSIQQTDMLRSYRPEGHDRQQMRDIEFRAAHLAYFEKTIELYNLAIENTKNAALNKKEKDDKKQDG